MIQANKLRKPKKYLTDSEKSEIIKIYFDNMNINIKFIAIKYNTVPNVISRLISFELKKRFEKVKNIK